MVFHQPLKKACQNLSIQNKSTRKFLTQQKSQIANFKPAEKGFSPPRTFTEYPRTYTGEFECATLVFKLSPRGLTQSDHVVFGWGGGG